MKANEHILDYISRVKDLREAIIDCNRHHTDLSEIESLTINSFINGLTREIRMELRSMRDRPANVVFDEAISAFKQLELDKIRYVRQPSEQRHVQFVQ
ncbi:hypothetical protein WH47_06142 [Habropoda laboriosa]|uniref:Uncharacterized protein n=1 Tax=Habropoda laboriosa TaxID=597456 RepID=A0A0L7RK23_9HYME|nr:hypothetical protein WH47_06142 [Habropoda laboriosa]